MTGPRADGGAAVPEGMVLVPSGSFTAGSDDFYPEERPAHRAAVGAFALDRAPVTVAQFARFVAETGHVTVAERPVDPADYPGTDVSGIQPGALVFTGTAGPVPLHDPARWWRWVPGASWRHPEGPGSDALADRAGHPVVQVCLEDAEAYATWAGRRLPTERELEYAARGGRDGTEPYAWGSERSPGGRHPANTWQGAFPYVNTRDDGWARTSPVGTYPENGFGLVDTIGNVWEWTSTPWSDDHRAAAEGAPAQAATPSPCCAPARTGAHAPARPRDGFVVKGGSHLCAPEYCLRYRPPARQRQERDSATGHLGFRTAADL